MCQYCGCHENTIIGRFADEHVRLINLSGEMLRAINTTDTGRAHDLAVQTRDLLHPHTGAEERGLFAGRRRFVDRLRRRGIGKDEIWLQ